MAISKEQRGKNTLNKLKNDYKESYEHPVKSQKLATKSSGFLSSKMKEAGRNLGMDEASGSTDYSGGDREHAAYKNISKVVSREADTSEKRRAIAALMKPSHDAHISSNGLKGAVDHLKGN